MFPRLQIEVLLLRRSVPPTSPPPRYGKINLITINVIFGRSGVLSTKCVAFTPRFKHLAWKGYTGLSLKEHFREYS